MLLLVWAAAFSVAVAVSATGVLGPHDGSPVALAAVAAAIGAIILLWRRLIALAGTSAWFGLGIVLGAAAGAPVRPHPVLEEIIAGERSGSVAAVIERGPIATGSGLRLVLELESIDGVPVRGRISLGVARGRADDLLPGVRVRFDARLYEPRGLANEGLPDSTLAYRAAGIVAVAGVPDVGRLRRETPPGWGPRAWAMRARNSMRQAVNARLGSASAAFLHTMVLGERSGLPTGVEEGFRAAGATHALSVSGLHLAAVAAVFFGGARRLLVRVPRLPLWVNPGALAAVLALPAVLFYALLTGEAVATLRSAVMVAVGLAAVLFRRRASSPAAIGAAALILLVPSPLTLFDVSFQLTFASVTGLALLAHRLEPPAWLRTRGAWRRRAARWGWRMGAASLAATVATAPLVAHAFGEITPASLPGNLVLVPLVELVVVPVGLAGATLASFCPLLGAPFLVVAGFAARAAMWIAEGFRIAAPIWLVRSPGWLETAALTLGGALLAAGLCARAARRLAVAGALLLAGAGLVLLGRDVVRLCDPDLRMTFIDVGQGDSMLVELPGGKSILIDGGGAFDGSFDPGARIVEPFLRARGITSLELVVLTHAHPDHLNGLIRVLERFQVGALWLTGADADNPEHDRLLRTAAAHRVPCIEPSPLDLGGARITPLGPWLDGHIATPPGVSANNSSLVLRVAFGGRAVLLAGDIDEEGEAELIGAAAEAAGGGLTSDALKIPHHGSRQSCGLELLDAVRPQWAVISVGWRNRFGFPSAAVLRRLAERQVRVLRTDLHGGVSLRISPVGDVQVTCARGCR